MCPHFLFFTSRSLDNWNYALQKSQSLQLYNIWSLNKMIYYKKKSSFSWLKDLKSYLMCGTDYLLKRKKQRRKSSMYWAHVLHAEGLGLICSSGVLNIKQRLGLILDNCLFCMKSSRNVNWSSYLYVYQNILGFQYPVILTVHIIHCPSFFLCPLDTNQ